MLHIFHKLRNNMTIDEFINQPSEEICEGLIRTVNVNKVEELITLGKIRNAGYPRLYKNGVIGLRYSMEKDKPNIDIDNKSYESINTTMNNFGYFLAMYIALSTYLKPEKVNDEILLDIIKNKPKDLVELVYYPKFSAPIELSKLPKFIYHICDGSVIGKIKKIGLSPKTNNKIELHPDRVYFCKTMDCLKELLKHSNFIKTTTSDKFYLLKIEVSRLDEDIDFYIDPSHNDAIYTYQNIHPSEIIIAQELNKKK